MLLPSAVLRVVAAQGATAASQHLLPAPWAATTSRQLIAHGSSNSSILAHCSIYNWCSKRLAHALASVSPEAATTPAPAPLSSLQQAPTGACQTPHQQPFCSEQGTVTFSERQAAAGGFTTGVTTMATGQGFKKTFYKRKLPTPPSTAFASPEGRQLFAEALATGHMSGFFKLMEQFSTQDEPSFCGLASLAMVLNALAIDPRRTWKGAWRWFHEQMLDCCRPLEDVKREGITLPQAACLARCNGARVEMHRYGTFTLDELRQQVVEVCASGEQHLVVSYSRRTFLQTGDGHFSPIGGYHAGKDLVLILDVARFKYPPHWVPLPMLFEAMQYVDPVTQLPRGFLRLSAQPLLASVLLTLDVRSACWQQANDWLRAAAPQVVQAAAASPSVDIHQLVGSLVASLPLRSLDAFLVIRDNSMATPHTSRSLTPSHSRQDVSALDGCSTDVSAQAGVSGVATASHMCGHMTGVGGSIRGSMAQGGMAHSSGARQGSDGLQGLHGVAEDEASAAAAADAAAAMDRCLPVQARQQLLAELQALPLFLVVRDVMLRSGALDACTALMCDQQPVPHTHSQHHTHQRHQHAQQQQRQQQQQQHLDACKAQLDTPPQPQQAGSQHHHQQQQQQLQPQADSQQQLQLQPHQLRQQGNSGFLAEKATMLLLMRGRDQWPHPSQWADAAAGKAWATLMDVSMMSIVEAELAFLREQWVHIDEVVAGGNVEGTCGSGSCDSRLDCKAHRHA